MYDVTGSSERMNVNEWMNVSQSVVDTCVPVAGIMTKSEISNTLCVTLR